MSSSQFAQASAAPVRAAPPMRDEAAELRLLGGVPTAELDAIAQVVAETTSMSTATIRP